MEFGSGVITDLDRFIMPPSHMCDVDGNELTDERGDYMRKWYDEKTSSTFGYTEHQGTQEGFTKRHIA